MKHKDELFYPCLPSLHTECTKTSCYLNDGQCRLTTHKEFSIPGSVGITRKQLIEQDIITTKEKD